MNRLKQVTTPIRENSGKKLQGFTVLTTLLVAFIVFSAGLLWNSYLKLKMLDQYIREVPVIVKDREDELITRSHVFEEDLKARGDLGTRIFQEEEGLSEIETLKKICHIVSAESVSLTDENGTVLLTTGPVMPEELFEERVRTLEMVTPVLELYPSAVQDENSEFQKTDGTAFVMFPVEGDNGRRLVFEFTCDPMLDIYNTIGNWNSVLERMLSGLEAYAFVRTGEDTPTGYPLDSFSKEERERMKQESAGIFEKSRLFLGLGEETSYGLVSFRNRAAPAVLYPYPYMESEILLVVPLWSFVCTGVFCALTLSLFIIFSLILFSLYALRLCGPEHGKENREAFRRGTIRKARPGRNILLAAVGIFSLMILLLESNATLAFIGTTKRAALQYEVNWHENQRKTIRNSYSDIYLSRTQALAELLTDHKDYRTHEALNVLNDAMRAEYLMLFDRNGHEITASNSYTGFSVGESDSILSEEYRAVLLGYPHAVVGPEKDPYTKKQQFGTAVLLTEENGEPDGFVLAVFDAGSMNAELKKESLEHTVSTFAVAEGYAAAVINDENGKFLAHTDEKKIGLQADDYITDEAYGADYEGFTLYDGKDMYVSGVSTNGKSLLFMVPDHMDEKLSLSALLMIAAVLLIIRFLYCPKACRLCACAMDEAIENNEIDEEDLTDRTHPLMVFASGYAVFFTMLALITLPAASAMYWPAFYFVFGGMWSKGVHLFSLWAALFFLSATVCCTILLRTLLQGAEKRAASRTRTILKLADSFVAYAAGALGVIGVLYMFGVNTTALLASAGIVSIAVGMGAKDMAADIIAGIFIAIEDSIHMGDVIEISEWKGNVTDMGIRTIEITDDRQNVKILNNSQISDVVNMSRKKTSCILELPIERRVSMADAEQILKDAVAEAMEEMPELYGSLQMEGIHGISEESFMARFSYSCAEAAREPVRKKLREFLKKEIVQDMDKISGK